MGIKITGIDTPFGGVSWEYTEISKNGIQELFYYLETKRILINPVEMELKSWCAQSAIEMKREIASILSKYKFNSDTVCWLRAMIKLTDTSFSCTFRQVYGIIALSKFVDSGENSMAATQQKRTILLWKWLLWKIQS